MNPAAAAPPSPATADSSCVPQEAAAVAGCQHPPDDPPPYPGVFAPAPAAYYHMGTAVSPPDYRVAATLPTYEQAEQAKAGKASAGAGEEAIRVEVVLSEDELEEHLGHHGADGSGRRCRAPVTPSGASGFALLAFPSMDESLNLDATDAALLGNDFLFFTAFLLSFLFNWIGFLILMCFCHTIAARYGALSGFGLSLAKWTLIVKNSTDLASADNAWLWWLMAAFGMLVCIRAIFQYLQIKKNWRQLPSAARERLFLFY